MKEITFFPRFNQLNSKSINVDYHLHSTWTDGQNTIQEIINTAINNNLNSIAITDHIRETSTYFDKYEQEIKLLNENTPLNVYTGFEAKISNFQGEIDVKKDVASRADIAIASVHRFQLGNKLYHASEFSKNIAQEIELELNLAAIKNGGFNVLGHPGGMSLTFFDDFPTDFFEKIIINCKKYDIAFDFNGRYHNSNSDILIPLLQKYNPFVSISSDSHNIKYIGTWNTKLEDIII